MEWMILPLRCYFDFFGRSQRKEFWMFWLFTVVVSMILSILDSLLGLGGSMSSFSNRAPNAFAAGGATSGGILTGLFSLGVLIPWIAVSVRRLHDRDRTGWWLLAPYGLITIGAILAVSAGLGGGGPGVLGAVIAGLGGIGFIVLFVWFCMDGTRGPNRFGPDPKGDLGDLETTFR